MGRDRDAQSRLPDCGRMSSVTSSSTTATTRAGGRAFDHRVGSAGPGVPARAGRALMVAGAGKGGLNGGWRCALASHECPTTSRRRKMEST